MIIWKLILTIFFILLFITIIGLIPSLVSTLLITISDKLIGRKVIYEKEGYKELNTNRTRSEGENVILGFAIGRKY